MPGRAEARFSIDQALHGYKQGHRWLGGSIRLEGSAQATLLALSDLLTSDLAAGQSSYLSGYPLKEENKFVLSRTWLAPESPRPGSVWTHSLIVDYAALTLIDDLSLLLPLFRRPDSPSDPSYGGAIPSHLVLGSNNQKSTSLNNIDVGRAKAVLRGLYGAESSNTVSIPAKDPEEDEALAIAIWRQMWPGLRRDFAFFTRVRGEVGEVKAGSALNFRTDEFANPQSNARPGLDRAYDLLVRDLPEAGPTGLRRFLGRYAFDAPFPRRIVPDLVLLHEQRDQPAAVASTLSDRFAGTSNLTRLKRDTLVHAIHSDSVDTVVDVLGAFRDEPISASTEEIDSLVSKSLHRDPYAVARILVAATPSKEGDLGDAVTQALARQAKLADLAQAPVSPETRLRLLHLRRDLSSEAAFWPDAEADRQALLDVAFETTDAATLLLALQGRITASEALLLLTRYGKASEHPLFESMRSRLPDPDAWRVVQNLVRRPGFLNRETGLKRSVGLRVADMIVGELLPDTGLKPEGWLALLKRETSNGSLEQAPNLAVGALIAALGAAMPIAARLTEACFDTIYVGLDRWTLPTSLRQVLDDSLGRHSKEWRPVDKLVAAVIDQYGGPGRADPYILLVTSRPDALRSILDRVERKGGKGALERLAVKAVAQDDARLDARIEFLREFAKRHDMPRWPW